jgi:hypothetical protein
MPRGNLEGAQGIQGGKAADTIGHEIVFLLD